MELRDLLREQDGVVSRAQVLACGEASHDIRRRIRRREWAIVVPGVYVDHTGPLTWEQRAVAGVLHAAAGLDREGRPTGAALAGHAALRHAIGPGWRRQGERPIQIAIGVRRSVRAVAGYRFVRSAGLTTRVDALRTPPRVRPAEAVADLVVASDDLLDVVSVVADAIQTRCVTVDEICRAVDSRERVRRREVLLAVLDDVTGGTCSALEHLFLAGVVRPHGLPEPQRQVRHVVADGGRVERRDAEWPELGAVCELDGQLFHDNARQRDVDLDRDLDDAAEGRVAVRLGWGQVTRRPCRTARRLDLLLRTRGWTGAMTRCPECQ